ncbi:MAG: hypothetical protein NC311_09965 [Muribaculaceae bacterium]|nr:hypothetical protein [Muribaculaceae bacterium]
MNKDYEILSPDGVTLYRGVLNENCIRRFSLMNEDSITLCFSLRGTEAVDFPIGSSVGDYIITRKQSGVWNANTGEWDYQLKLDAYYWAWANKILWYAIPGSTAAKEAAFTLTASINLHASVIKNCLDMLGYRYGDSPFSIDLSGFNQSGQPKAIKYENLSVLGGIQAIAEAFECEWWVDRNTVYFGKMENHGSSFVFRAGDNVSSISFSQGRTEAPNRLYVFGSTRNLASGYSSDSDTIGGIVERRLTLPGNMPYLQTDPYIPEAQVVEKVVTFDDIYPKVELTITEEPETYTSDTVTVDKGDKEEDKEGNEDEVGDTTKEDSHVYYRIKYDEDFPFLSSYILPGQELHIVFLSGALNGMDFGAKFNPKGLNEKDIKGNINPEAQMLEIVANEDYGRLLPDSILRPCEGDKFTLYGWDASKMEELGLIAEAQARLLTEGQQALWEYAKDTSTCTCPMAWDYLKPLFEENRHPKPGDTVTVIDTAHFGEGGRGSRIIGCEYTLDRPYAKCTYTCGENVTVSRLKSLEDKIDGIAKSGAKVQLQNSLDFLSKRYADRTPYLLSSDTGFEVGRFLDGVSGGKFFTDKETGRSVMELDELFVRVRAIFETLTIINADVLAGRKYVTPGGGVKCSSVEEVLSEDGNLIAWRCLFLSEQDGEKRETHIKTGDQALSEDFNVGPGTHHKVSNHRWWRLVTDVSNDYITDEVGNHYGYIEVSATDCERGSDIPQPDDEIAHLGNRTDPTRQGAIILDTVGSDSPSVKLFTGIGGGKSNEEHYTLSGRDFVSYGYDHAKGNAYFKCYGDTYIGDPDGDTFIKYDKDGKALDVAARISVKSTIDGVPIDKYIQSIALEDIEGYVNAITAGQLDDIRRQIDGAIETWFGNGAPSLENHPASDWGSETLRQRHAGDLYYDNDTGYAYRFSQDPESGKWDWYTITDDAITKALAEAAKAYDLADRKRRTFATAANTLPTPPYDEGDIWASATFAPLYSDDILRCVTPRPAGEPPQISDWTPASRYTDDSALNDFRKEYDSFVEGFHSQIDGMVETFVGQGEPTPGNYPASDWTTEADRSAHAGDLYYDTLSGYAYQWTGSEWRRKTDSGIAEALAAAGEKRRVFLQTPYAPYDGGDLWIDSGGDGNTLRVCVQPRPDSSGDSSFHESDWVVADNAALNALGREIYAALDGIKDQADQKAETWVGASDPRSLERPDGWKGEDDSLHIGDLWLDTSDPSRYVTSMFDGSGWVETSVPLSVFDLIDGKSSIFTSKPVNGYSDRDLWFLERDYKGSEALGDPPSDHSEGTLMVAIIADGSRKREPGDFHPEDWFKKDRYTDDSRAQEAIDTLTEWAKDGVFDPDELKGLRDELARVQEEHKAIKAHYDSIMEYLSKDGPADNDRVAELTAGWEAYSKAYAAFTSMLSAILAATPDKFGCVPVPDGFTTTVGMFYNTRQQFILLLSLAVKVMVDGAYGYIKEALGEDTTIDGGLILTSLIKLGYNNSSIYTQDVYSGISGVLHPEYGERSIAAWFGGDQIDREIPGFASNPKRARALFRMDGTGYLADGSISWNTDGSGKVAGGALHWDAAGNVFIGSGITIEGLGGDASQTLASILNYVNALNSLFIPEDSSGNPIAVDGSFDISKVYAIRAKRSLYSEGFLTAKGKHPDGSVSGGGLTMAQLNAVLADYVLKTDFPTLGGALSSVDWADITGIPSWIGAAKPVYSYSEILGAPEEYVLPMASGETLGGVKIGSGLARNAQGVLAVSLSASHIPSLDWSKITSGKPTTLKGYGITDGVNDVAVSGSGNAVTSALILNHQLVLSKGETFLAKKTWDDVFEVDADGNLHAKVGIYSDSFLTAKGEHLDGGGTGGVDMATVISYLDRNGYATQQWVDNKGFLKEHQSLANYAKKTDVPKITVGDGKIVVDDKTVIVPTNINQLSGFSGLVRFGSGNCFESVDSPGTCLVTPYLSKDAAQTMYQPKGNYLTQHQSLADYAKKAEVPKITVGDGTLTIDNQLVNIPTKVSELANDSLFTTMSAVEKKGYTTMSAVEAKGFLTQHQSLAGYAKKTELPTKVSELTNDSGYTKFSGSYADLTNKPTLFDGKYSSLSGKPSIPTKVSQLDNDSGFLKEHQSLAAYAKKTDVPNVSLSDGTITIGGQSIKPLTQHQSLSGLMKTSDLLGQLKANNVPQFDSDGNLTLCDANTCRVPAYLTKDSAKTLYQPKGNYITSHQSLANYVTLNGAQTITGAKTFTNKLIVVGDWTNDNGLYLYEAADTTVYGAYVLYGASDKLRLGTWNNSTSSVDALEIKRGIADVTFLGKIIKSGGTSSQFLKADGSVDSTTYLPRSGGTMTGALNFANNTANIVGDDVKIGDFNAAGQLGIQGVNGASGIAFLTQNQTWGSSATRWAMTWNGSNMAASSTALFTNLNADLLDGVQGAAFMHLISVSDLNTVGGCRVFPYNPNTTNSQSHYGVVAQFSNSSTAAPASSIWLWQLNDDHSSGLLYRRSVNSASWSAWRAVAFTDSNVASASQLATARSIWGQSFNGTANVSGNMTGVGSITFADLTGTNVRELLFQKMADNDYFRIRVGGTASNAGYAEIATADDGNEPIYVRQYSGVFTNLQRTLTLLDGSGNTHIPGSVGVGTTSPSYKLDVAGDALVQGWLRTTGERGWYSQNHGGGIYMADDTWIRTYGSKSFYHDTGIMRTDGQFHVGNNGSRFLVDSDGNTFVRTANAKFVVSPFTNYDPDTAGADGQFVGFSATVNGSNNLVVSLGGSTSVQINLQTTGEAASLLYRTNGTVKRLQGTGLTELIFSAAAFRALSATLSTTLTVNGASTLKSTLTVNGASTLKSTLGVEGAATLSSSLDVSGTTSLASALYALGATYLRGTVRVAGSSDNADSPALRLGPNYNRANGAYMKWVYDNTGYSNGRLVFCTYAKNGWHTDSSSSIEAMSVASGGLVTIPDLKVTKLNGQSVTQVSDIRLKDVAGDASLSLADIAESPLVWFRWKDRRDPSRQIGTIAQYWLSRLPEVVQTGHDGFLGVQYGVLADAKATVVSRHVLRHEEDLARLHRRVGDLEQEVKLLRQHTTA